MEVLESRRLIIRKWMISDKYDLYEYAKSDLVGPSAGWKPHRDVDESEEIIRVFTKRDDSYAIVLKSENKVIGGIGLHDRKPDETITDLEQKEIG